MTTRLTTAAKQISATTAAVAIALGALVGTTAPAQAASVTTWDKVAACESSGDWSINTGTVYTGGLQISNYNWQYYGGTAYAPRAYLATKMQQILIAEKILADQGYRAWSCWPGTGLDTDTANPYPDQTPTVSPTSQQFFHDIRLANGSWTAFGSLDGYAGSADFKGAEAAITGMPDGSAQVVGIGLDGNVYHEIRSTNGSWSGFAQLNGVGTPTMQARKVAIAGMPDGTAQVLAIGNDGNVYHETRSTNGTWSGFAPINGVGTPTMQASNIAITAMPDGSSQVLAIGNDGNTYHEARLTNGSWTGFAPINGVGTPTMQAGAVAITGMPDGTSQVLAIGNDGNVYHETRQTNGTWSGFAPINGVGTPTMQASNIAITAMPDGSSQVLAIGNDGNTYHETRQTNGSWTGFAPIAGYGGASTFAAQRVAIAGMPDGSSQILATGR